MRKFSRPAAACVAMAIVAVSWVVAVPGVAFPAAPFHVKGADVYEINDTLLRRFPSRYGGTDQGSPHQIAHDEYGTEVVKRMLAMVRPLGGYAEKRDFIDSGTRFSNLVAVIPGADPVLKNQFVVLGGHYDCTQTHLDGAVDCGMQVAVDLAVLDAFTQYYIGNGVRPARSLMILFTDGEEQGLYGSVSYTTIGTYRGIEHFELPPHASVVAFHDTDMIGANYPGRYFGKSTLDFMPLHIFSAPTYLDPNPAIAAIRALPAYLSPTVLGNLGKFRLYRDEMRASRDRMFLDMREKFGYRSVTYSDGGTRPVFTESQKKYINIIDDPLDRSDHAVFILQGIPADLDIGINDPSTAPPGFLEYHNNETLEFLNWMYSGQQRRNPLTELGMETGAMFVAYMMGANHSEPGLFSLGEVDA